MARKHYNPTGTRWHKHRTVSYSNKKSSDGYAMISIVDLQLLIYVLCVIKGNAWFHLLLRLPTGLCFIFVQNCLCRGFL